MPLVTKAPFDERKNRVMSGMIIEPMTIDPTIAEIPSPKLISPADIASSGPSVLRAITSSATATQASTGIMRVSDAGALEAIVDELIAINSAQVDQYRAADASKQKKLIGFFVGQAMKASKGQANPQLLNQLLKEKLSAS